MWFERLGKRERIILITGAVFLAVFFLATGMILPLVNAHSALEKNIAQKEQQIIKAFDLAAKIHSVEKISEKAALRKDSGFSVFSFIEKLASNTGVKNRLEYIKPISGSSAPGQEIIEVRIKGIGLHELVQILEYIDSSPHPLMVKKLYLRRLTKDKTLDITFQVSPYG